MPPSESICPSASTGLRRWWPRLRQGALTVLVAFTIGRLSGAAMRADARLTEPPGFTRGILHGALMPIAWPSLLLGQDHTIYAEPNSGRTYKIGYSLGVNVCGAGFFGWVFWRVSRWRARKGG